MYYTKVLRQNTVDAKVFCVHIIKGLFTFLLFVLCELCRKLLKMTLDSSDKTVTRVEQSFKWTCCH